MIDLSLTAEQSMAQDAARRLTRDFIANGEAGAATAQPARVLDAMWALGMSQLMTPDAEGQQEFMHVLVLEQLAGISLDLAHTVSSSLLTFRGLLQMKAQDKASHAARFTDGGFVGAVTCDSALPEASSQAAIDSVRTPALLASRQTEWLLAFDRHPAGALNARLVTVPRPLDGIHFSTLGDGFVGVCGRPQDWLLNRTPGFQSDFDPIDLARLRIAKNAHLSALLTGLSQQVMDYIVTYTKQRYAHGQFLAQKQSVAFRLAEMAMRVSTMRLMTWRLATQIEDERPPLKQAVLCRHYAGKHAMWIADEALQLMGGYGFAREYPMERWYRQARFYSAA